MAELRSSSIECARKWAQIHSFLCRGLKIIPCIDVKHRSTDNLCAQYTLEKMSTAPISIKEYASKTSGCLCCALQQNSRVTFSVYKQATTGSLYGDTIIHRACTFVRFFYQGLFSSMTRRYPPIHMPKWFSTCKIALSYDNKVLCKHCDLPICLK